MTKIGRVSYITRREWRIKRYEDQQYLTIWLGWEFQLYQFSELQSLTKQNLPSKLAYKVLTWNRVTVDRLASIFILSNSQTQRWQ